MPRLLSELENWIIENPYSLTDEDREILSENPVTKAKDWYKKEYKPIRDRIRKHYHEIQNGTCCYCRMPIKGGTDNIEIEHIVDKNQCLDFMFEPLNLVISCHNCNFTKTTKNVLHCSSQPTIYPTEGNSFKIIHGHYHRYFDHIEFLQGSIYHGISDEGFCTIDFCGLDREGLAEQREEEMMYKNDPIIADVIDIRNSENCNDKIDALIEKLKRLKDN